MTDLIDRVICWLSLPICWVRGHDPEHPVYCPDWCARCDRRIGPEVRGDG